MSRNQLIVVGVVGLAIAAGVIAFTSSEPERVVGPEATVTPSQVEPNAPPVAVAAPSVAVPVEAPAVPSSELPYPTEPGELLKAVRPLQGEVEVALRDFNAACPWGRAFVELSLESHPGEVRIVGAVAKIPPEETGNTDHDMATPEVATDAALVSCVESKVKGQRLRTPSARPGRTWQMFYRPSPTPQ